MQLTLMWVIQHANSVAVVGLRTTNQNAYVSSLFAQQLTLRGGLKWTRTTDLTLIRRVL